MARTSYSPRRAPFPLLVLPGDSPCVQPLEELVHQRLLHRRPRPLFLHGPSLRTLDLAMEHLAYVFADEERLVLAGDASRNAHPSTEELLCSILEDPRAVPEDWSACLLSVSESAIHDYLLANHPDCAAQCIARLAREPLAEQVLEDHERCAVVLEKLAHAVYEPEVWDASGDLRKDHAHAIDRHAARVFLAQLRAAKPRIDPPSWTPAFCAAVREQVAQDPELRVVLTAHLEAGRGRLGPLLSTACILMPGFRPPRELSIPLEDLYLADIDLCGWSLTDNVLRCDLSRARLRGIRARDLLIIHALMPQADLREADLDGTVIDRCDLSSTDLRSAQLVEIRSSQTIWCNARLERASLRGATLLEARLDQSRLVEALLDGALFCDSALVCASLENALAEGAAFTRCEFRGAVARGMRARRAAFLDCDLSGSDWSGGDLRGASFLRVRCRDQRLGPADFRGARLDPDTAQELRRLGAWV